MANKTIAMLHPGNMGATIGAAAATSGARVLWCSAGRSAASRQRAEQAGLHEAKTVRDAVGQSDIVLSVCPPEAALSVAQQLAQENFQGIYVDANAVSRATAEQIGAVVTKAGARFVDGGIIGSPVKKAGTTRLYLSGAGAKDIAALFSQSMLDARAISEVPGEASALKVAYAAWTKGTDALILAIRAYAQYEGVDQALLEEWKISQPSLEQKTVRAAATAAPKMWRYTGEMEEISAAFKVAGLPGGFHEGAARLCERLAGFKDMTDPPLPVDRVIAELLRR
ncbi:MAG: NAD(P)-dependent oxidoreductase [Deltaproteobacteria bacterium]|nr:NAD(P)-dependent oxidoreductase [Deltaproteobacteria bacterium]